MNQQSRRQFIGSSAVALGVAGGLGTGITSGFGAVQDGEIPAFAEWIPEGEIILNQQGELGMGTYTFESQLELFGEVSAGGQRPFQFEPFVYTAGMIRLWRALTVTDLAEPILGSLNDAQSAGDVDPSGVPAERHLLIDRTSVYTGSFDTDAIAESVQNSDATETQFDGVYEYPNTAVIAWGDGYLIQGDSQNVEQVAAIRNTGDGDQTARYENTPDLEQLLRAVDHSGQTVLRLTDDGTLSVDQYSEVIDHSPIEGATSYVGTLGYDVEATEFDATSVLLYPDEGSVDTELISGIITSELSQEITADGRSVRVTARYDRADVGFDIDDSDDSTDGEDGIDGDDSTDGDDTSDGTDGSDGEDGMDGQNDSNSTDGEDSSDGSGPGFGLMTGLSAVGGAGYLLSQRLGDDAK